MTEFDADFMTKAQVNGVKELVDLCRNGYQVLFGADLYSGRRYKLRHSRNGRTLMMEILRYSYTIREGERVLKMVVYDDDGKVIQPES